MCEKPLIVSFPSAGKDTAERRESTDEPRISILVSRFSIIIIIAYETATLNRKLLPYIFLALLAIAVFFVRRCRGISNAEGRSTSSASSEVNRNHGFDRRTSYLEYTRHAKCRMECRHITQKEVEEIMREGEINYRKSEVKATPCPTYAIEGNTSDNQHVRIVFAQCDYKTKVVTVIDLNEEWQCDCPGDESKYKNGGK